MRLTATERRQAIIQSAIRLFSEKGFRGTTTRELAASVGVTEPVIYQHFATKKDLYAAIIESKARQTGSELEVWTEAGCGDDHRAFLALGRLIWHWFEDDPTLMRLLFFSVLEGNELADLFFNRHASGFLDALSRHIRSRIEAGTFRQLDADTLAWMFIGMVAHQAESACVFRFNPKPRPREMVLEEMVDVFLRGVIEHQTVFEGPKGSQHAKTGKQQVPNGRRPSRSRTGPGSGGRVGRVRKKG